MPRLFVLFLVALSGLSTALAGCESNEGRVRVGHAQVVGIYEIKLDNGSERLELKSDGTYIQDVISKSRPLRQTGQWHLENHFFGGTDVILTNAAVSEEDEKLPVRFGELTLNVHDRSGKPALARNEVADWYFERTQ